MTTWIFHHLFADSECVPSGEQRLMWKKKDDNGAASPLRIFQADDDGRTPEEKAYNLDPTDVRIDAEKLLGQLEVENTQGTLREFTLKFRNTLIRAALEKRRNAEVLRKMIDGDIPSSEQALRLKLEELLKPDKKPQGDDALRAAIEETRKEVKTDLQKDDPSWGTLFLDKIREKLQQLGPMYRRLQSFLSNPEVQNRIGLSPDQAFLALSRPEERLSLFQRLAAMRHDLVFQGSRNIGERRRALDDLFAFFYHGQHMLSPDERIAFYDTYMRVGACSAAINEYDARLKDNEDSQKAPETDVYREKFQHVGRFLREDRESSSRTITGKNGLIARLESASTKEGEGKNAFGILAEGLREGGWIPEVPESLRYTCTLIALEELGYLYMRMASGSSTMPKDTASLTAHVKMLVLEALRRGTTGKKADIPFDITYVDPRKDFDVLEKKIQATLHPTSEDADELILLYAWLERRGEAPRMSYEELQKIRDRVEATEAELVTEVERTQKLLPKDIPSGSPVDIMSALEAILEEEKLYESAAQKNRIREAPTFHDETDAAYVEKLRTIRALPKNEEKKKSLLNSLDEAYDKGNLERQKIHALQLAEQKTVLLEALQAELRLQARKNRMQYLEALKEHANEIKHLDQDPFQHELDTARMLENLEHLNLVKSSSPHSEAEIAFAELQALAEIVRHPLAEAKTEQSVLEQAREAAAELLKDSEVDREASAETKEYLRIHSASDAPIGAKAVKALLYFQQHPDEFLEGEKNFLALKPELKIYRPSEAADHPEWKAEKELVFSRIRTILPAFDPPSAYGLTARFEVDGREDLDLAEPSPEARQHLHRLQKFADVLERVNAMAPLELPENAFENETDLPSGHFGAFIRKPEGKECIILNSAKIAGNADVRKAVLLEERLHALNYALARYLGRSYFQNVYRIMEKAGGAEFQSLSQKWVKREQGMTNRDWQWEVTDEFLAKRRVFLNGSHATLTQEEIAFFKDLDERGVNPFPVSEEISLDEQASYRRAAAAGPGGQEDNSSARDAHEHDSERNGYAEGSRISENLYKSKQALFKARKFLETYPSHGAYSSENAAYIDELEKEYNELNKNFLETRESEKNADLEARANDLKEKFEKVEGEISKFDMIQEDLRTEPPKGRGFIALWKDVQWVSFFDITRMFKDIVEDIKRQYNRRQEGKVGRIGESVTHWIPAWIPYLGNLHHEFHDRRQKAELDEVEHFKKALENIDAFELQFMTHHTSNKDHLKAIMTLLTERGRMNWNDDKMWHNLNSLSIYKMPIQECQRNENLREAWLRKIISDIWEDKDLYRSWKTKNEGAFEEKMKGYTNEADRLSNLKGGLKGELMKQLRVYVEHKEKKLHQPLDETVRPQLYNEILDYAIRNGKMSMEDKFFYLVQGLSTGLLSMDRLRILAGEKGGILNIFPFIDYFYGRNNTKQEIDALATRLRESDDWTNDNYYKPGLKTTLWLELEVAREDSVKQRLSKGMSKRGGEADHDDMHFFIPRLDYKSIGVMALPQGGGRPQLSPEAWENAYTGYNSFFKHLGTLAKLEGERGVKAKFTSEDAQSIVQAVAGYVRMDGILTGRSTMGDSEGRRSGLTWGRMKSRRSVVNTSGKTVYEERGLVENFTRDLLRAYGWSKQELDIMLYSTEHEGILHETKSGPAKKLSDELESRFYKALNQDGMAKLKQVLSLHVDTLATHAEDFDYERAKHIFQEQAKNPAKAPVAAPFAPSH